MVNGKKADKSPFAKAILSNLTDSCNRKYSIVGR